jgi:hypothetical protein
MILYETDMVLPHKVRYWLDFLWVMTQKEIMRLVTSMQHLVFYGL